MDILDESSNYIEKSSYKAFQALKGYYDGIVDLADLQQLIEPAVMIQRILRETLINSPFSNIQ
jgi:hypothetical protein